MKRLNGKTVVLTGAAGGIGSLVAQGLRSYGAYVIGIDRLPCLDSDEAIEGDLASFDGISALCDSLAARRSSRRRIDVLVNLAGIQHFGPLSQQPPENLWAGYVINLIAPAMLAQAVIPGMKARGRGQIVNIGSVFGAIPFAHFASYSSAKAGLRGLSEALRRELADSGIRVTHIAPRAVSTPLNSGKVMAFAKATKMTMDPPALVARRILKAIANEDRDVVIGFPETLFVRINALAPQLVDRALAANDRKAAEMFHWNR